ncbi:SDR family NAD(P)-dependent oxidoreductase [Microbacterium sp. A94]|uniref:SDR family NAD(P)-dependent oxidoreductase n=1 Tax=Microbacterium sp. A94 TaxID=3450717 RepID=UPI003F423157
MTTLRLQTKTAIVTGAAGGIGRAIVARFVAQGAHVVATDRDPEHLNALFGHLKDEVHCVAADLAADQTPHHLAEAAREQFGGADVLVNNAAFAPPSDVAVLDAEIDLWRQVMDVNLYAPVKLIQAVLPGMLEARTGSIINIGSGAGLFGDVSRPAYGASKAALGNFTQYVATQHGKQGIRANVLSPGLMLHDGLKAMPQELIDAIQRSVLATRPGAADDIAHAAVFLASDESQFINGQVWRIDGGMGAQGPHVASVLALAD